MNKHWDTALKLRSYGSVVKDADGYTVRTLPADTEVWGDERGVTRAEFYDALSAGERVEKVWRVRVIDYSGQDTVVDEDGEVYDVVRLWKPNIDTVELNCRRRQGR